VKILICYLIKYVPALTPAATLVETVFEALAVVWEKMSRAEGYQGNDNGEPLKYSLTLWFA
jgi:hypothetical protein